MSSIDELRKASGNYMGVSVRAWLPKLGKWADCWANADSGVVNPQAQAGHELNTLVWEVAAFSGR